MPPRARIRPQGRSLAARAGNSPGPEQELPADIQLVVWALAIAVVAAAIIVGVLAHSMTVAIIIAVVGLLALFSTTWISRR